MKPRWSGVTIDCAEPQALASFWSQLLDRAVTDEMLGSSWATVGSRHDDLPRLNFQRVPEVRAGKVRIHLDLSVDDIEDARRVVESLGGSWSGERHDYDEGTVLVMRDPEGNEFCIVEYA